MNLQALLITIITELILINTDHLHVGGTSLVNASNDFSDLYSCIKATVTTMIMACDKIINIKIIHYFNNN